MKNTRHAAQPGAKTDTEEFSRLESFLYVGASALATIAVLVWVARNYITAVL
jgi:hypothetical protein